MYTNTSPGMLQACNIDLSPQNTTHFVLDLSNCAGSYAGAMRYCYLVQVLNIHKNYSGLYTHISMRKFHSQATNIYAGPANNYALAKYLCVGCVSSTWSQVTGLLCNTNLKHEIQMPATSLTTPSVHRAHAELAQRIRARWAILSWSLVLGLYSHDHSSS